MTETNYSAFPNYKEELNMRTIMVICTVIGAAVKICKIIKVL